MQNAAANPARIDPAQCRLPPTRLPIFPDDCAQLIASIRTHGQLVPGLVRRTPPGDLIRYEITCGARRHYAIAALREQNPAAADRDNRDRADISDLRRATVLCEAGKGWL